MTIDDTSALLAAAAPDEDSAALVAGASGFIAILVIGGITVLLLLDMTRRVRRARYREQVRARLDAEEAVSDAPDDPAESAEGQHPSPRAGDGQAEPTGDSR